MNLPWHRSSSGSLAGVQVDLGQGGGGGHRQFDGLNESGGARLPP